MIVAFTFGGGSVSARRYKPHEKEYSHPVICFDRHSVGGSGCLSVLLRWPDLSRRSAMSGFASDQIAILNGKGAA